MAEGAAEFPLDAVSNGRSFFGVSRLFITDAPGRNLAVFEVTVQQHHRLGVVGRLEPAPPHPQRLARP